jgi:hypothetical protein
MTLRGYFLLIIFLLLYWNGYCQNNKELRLERVFLVKVEYTLKDDLAPRAIGTIDILLFQHEISIEDYHDVLSLIAAANHILNTNYPQEIERDPLSQSYFFNYGDSLRANLLGKIDRWSVYGTWTFVFFSAKEHTLTEFYSILRNSSGSSSLLSFPDYKGKISIANAELILPATPNRR